MEHKPLLEIKNLKAYFHTRKGRLPAVDGVDLKVEPGEIIGIVGESGSGKSVMSQSILRLHEYNSPIDYEGEILFEGEDILSMSKLKLREVRGNRIAIIFQDPLTSLNPVYTVGNQLDEVLTQHKKLSAADARRRTIELLKKTGIASPERCVRQYPHELSGGMQQRIMIAMALACEPKLLIADEPTTALDVTIQAQILELILELNRELGTAVLLITHDMGVLSEACTSVRVMYLGQVVEEAETDELFENPLHPYTKGLLQSIPRMNYDRTKELHVIPGTVPPLSEIPSGCHFSTRCPYAEARCFQREPPIFDAQGENHWVKCWLAKEELL
ncbi:oligopeptide transport ATP-binding protein OppD [Oxobacter pfennigii]|uniref:Oligopeptide transport ATP-binding protein OppD n=1 Tax=Oxobacter pfennigii TaxID=36849 RepID=A0A0P8Y7J1_9CLOT|nr:ABC transporter ATP-binding protein [Oxobacter pfennigii]KPU42447.1 oligopeptide transport ATP-binding protein OppD [Oxobacter pfennigii]